MQQRSTQTYKITWLPCLINVKMHKTRENTWGPASGMDKDNTEICIILHKQQERIKRLATMRCETRRLHGPQLPPDFPSALALWHFESTLRHTRCSEPRSRQAAARNHLPLQQRHRLPVPSAPSPTLPKPCTSPLPGTLSPRSS